MPENPKPQPKPEFEVKTFSEDQLYKIKKKNYFKKVFKYLQERIWLVYYFLFIIFFLGFLALIIVGQKTPPTKPKQQGMNLIAPANIALVTDALPRFMVER
jgi:hypothetical protein